MDWNGLRHTKSACFKFYSCAFWHFVYFQRIFNISLDAWLLLQAGYIFTVRVTKSILIFLAVYILVTFIFRGFVHFTSKENISYCVDFQSTRHAYYDLPSIYSTMAYFKAIYGNKHKERKASISKLWFLQQNWHLRTFWNFSFCIW